MRYLKNSVFDHRFCDKINNYRLLLLNGAYAEVDNHWRGKSDPLAFSRFYYILSGSATITYGGEVFELLPKRWYLLPAGLAFDYSCPAYMEQYFVHIKMVGHNGFDLLTAFGRPVEISVAEGTAAEFLSSFSRELPCGLKIRSILWQILLGAIEEYSVTIKETRFSEHVERAIKYINDNLSIALSVEEIAAHSMVSKSALNKAFRAELATSVCEYVSDRVLTEAKLHIEYERTPIGSISDALGFSDRFYFSKKFKKKYGVSPRECRRSSTMGALE